MQTSTFGIDIGHHLVKVVELRYVPRRAQTVAFASYTEIPRDRVTGAVRLIRTLKRVFPPRMRRTAQAALGVSGFANIVLKRIDLRNVEDDNVEAAAFHEAEQYLPDEASHFMTGFSALNPLINPKGRRSEVAFVALRRTMCEFYDEVFMSSHKNPITFEAAALALAATYQRSSLSSEERLSLIHI